MFATTDIALANALATKAQSFMAKADDVNTSDPDAITYYQAGAATYTRAAVVASNAAQDIALHNYAAKEYAKAAFNNAEAAGDFLNNARIYTDRTQVKTAADTAESTALLAINYAQQANSSPVPLVPTVVRLTQNLASAASALNVYLDVNGCNCTTNLVSVSSGFANLFNIDLAAGNITGTMSVNEGGNYGYATAYALALVNGGSAHVPCWGDGGICYGAIPQYSSKLLHIAPLKGTIPNHSAIVAIPWQELIIGASILTTLGFMGSSYIKEAWKQIPKIPTVSKSTKTALMIGSGLVATVTAVSLLPKTKILSPVSTFVNKENYTVVIPTSSIVFGSGPSSFAAGLSNWLVTRIVYYPNHSPVSNWPIDIPGLKKDLMSTVIYQGRWIGPTGPVPQAMKAYQ